MTASLHSTPSTMSKLLSTTVAICGREFADGECRAFSAGARQLTHEASQADGKFEKEHALTSWVVNTLLWEYGVEYFNLWPFPSFRVSSFKRFDSLAESYS